MKKGFTLVELVVAIAVLAMMSGFAGIIFNISAGSYRTATANAEIMQTLRAVTDQLYKDFRGIRKDAPMAIQFRKDVDGTRRDSIAFFATGDFQSIRQYRHIGRQGEFYRHNVSGNLASIYYGPATDPNILARKYKIFTSDPCLIEVSNLTDANEFLIDSLSVWRINLDNVNFAYWVASPFVDPHIEESLPLYLTGGLASFMVQIGNVNRTGPMIRTEWFPQNIDGTFGFFYNAPQNINLVDWSDQSRNWPKALKFTFTLCDSKHIVERKTFTYIVYIDNMPPGENQKF